MSYRPIISFGSFFRDRSESASRYSISYLVHIFTRRWSMVHPRLSQVVPLAARVAYDVTVSRGCFRMILQESFRELVAFSQRFRSPSRYSMTFPGNGDEERRRKEGRWASIDTQLSITRTRIGRSAKGILGAREAIRSLKWLINRRWPFSVALLMPVKLIRARG